MKRDEFEARIKAKIRGNDIILEEQEIKGKALIPQPDGTMKEVEEVIGTQRISVNKDVFWSIFGEDIEAPGPPAKVIDRLKLKDKKPLPDGKPCDRGYSKYFDAWEKEGLL